ncbi:hypothetical protein SHI21_05460 [Bacteriovorax sp. PP10]|uniref:Uncharacterized protein n=1 Tax=Bacteriovorax antarcticus TaxID=3088717 RepID=A0ABU5VRE5_9BACT|nr:hypothetical protein [Bacteriovorax sp. PP10]MEA9355633.1 hypothetical protein [Bacteriovorax sp. PP10]
MHHAKRFLFLILLTLTFTSTQSIAGGLTEIERPDCLSFPKIIDFKNAVANVHYEMKSYETTCDHNGNNCDYNEYLQINYKYLNVSTSDFYSRDGKFVTTRIIKILSDLTANGYKHENEEIEALWNMAAADLREQITKAIYNDPNGACEDSVYKN